MISDAASWREAIAEIGRYDYAHTYDFHQLSSSRGEGEPIAFAARDENKGTIAFWPTLKRSIDGSGAFDLTSVYGYAGPTVRSGAEGTSPIEAIFCAMSDFGAVSVFSRMHPLFTDQLGMAVRGDEIGSIVFIEITAQKDVLQSYRGSHRREIVNATAKGLTITCGTDEKSLEDFLSIYTDTMKEVEAKEYYYFDKEYLSSILNSKDFKTIILTANFEGKPVAASMFIITGSTMQYYLSGTVAAFRKLAPSKAIIAEAHRIAVELGLKKLVLGGGVGSAKDALYAFKKGFSQATLPFHVTRRILDQRKYIDLCVKRRIVPDQVQFFPAYRAPL
ncbi:peptidoglycan bridge formation glycyltransferase FemA/FemB family protein [Mesorhizobium sp. SP-1A]|uniref:peptidoglycan bridge formation glycyltransferase FemA/FemB family protein n=1 Tax=Mesorhizobium sp. SP-1A TaxID=3077840 RepID=UPI0028F732BC|nr:peptidoglycan bridge formation glycyltransferase FemA/FemB family protein [Mesorhizobium sp. SP-1A]